MTTTTSAWEVDSLRFSYGNADRPAVAGIDAQIQAGRCTAILGPNGSGKSTLLRLLLGTLKPAEGMIRCGGRPLEQWDRREFARTVGVVPQDEEIAFPITVRELVAMGRYPHLGPLRSPGSEDVRAVDEALDRCDLLPLAERRMQQLSGGERQRARVARALAQQPSILALDEPTRALDIRHEMEILELTRELVGAGVTVLLVTHNLNLAARYAERLLLLDRGSVVGDGTPVEVLSEDRIQAVYRWPVTMTRHPGPGRDTGAVQLTPLAGGETFNLQKESDSV